MKFIIVLFMIWSISIYSQNIYWNKDFILNWEHFKITDKARPVEAAKAYLGIKLFKIRTLNWSNKSEFTAVAYLSIDSSYYVPSKINELILQHEQTHFDITELYARKLRRILSQKKFIYDFDAKMIFNFIFIEHNKTQIEYEIDTSFGNKKNMQNYWANKIKLELEEITEYEYKIDNEVKEILLKNIRKLTTIFR